MADKKVNDNKKIDKQLDALSKSMGGLYQSTYQSRIDNKTDMDNIVGGIDSDIDKILSQANSKSASDLASLYLRVQNKNENDQEKVTKSLEEMFDTNGQLLDTISVDSMRRSIQAEDYQYDLICRYMSKLEDALDILKDNTLSADNFTKDFITVSGGKSNKDAMAEFNNKANIIKKEYNVQDLFEEMYWDASKYGEYFLYHVPYKKAFSRLLSRKGSNGLVSGRFETATDNTFDGEMLLESGNFDGSISGGYNLRDEFVDYINDSKVSFNLRLDDSGIISEPIKCAHEASLLKDKYCDSSITESYTKTSTFVNSENGVLEALKMDSNIDFTANDGFINPSGKRGEAVKDIDGSVLYKIPRDRIFPLVMHRTVIGYIYMEVSNTYVENLVLNGTSYNSITNNTKLMADEFDRENDSFISYIAGMISQKIDAKFINSNVDLKEQIYAVLRYNDKFCATNGSNNISVSFLPAQDVQHFYLRLNDSTHRGISDLSKSVVPAMIYCLLYLNTTIGQISRSQDKRVYYVKQNVEQNVARTLLNVISQIKKGNMGMRQLENMNTIFNVIGTYNDHVIPIGPSGDPPIQMEVMQGQQINTPTELMDRMEDSAINSTGVPLEFVQSVNNVDFATRFTMSNTKFMRKVYKRQRICQDQFTITFTKLYNYQYRDNLQTIAVRLPAPAFLAMTNSAQLVENTKNYAKSLAEIVCPKENEDVQTEFVNICARNFLGTYVDFSQIDEMVVQAQQNIVTNKNTADLDDEEE